MSKGMVKLEIRKYLVIVANIQERTLNIYSFWSLPAARKKITELHTFADETVNTVNVTRYGYATSYNSLMQPIMMSRIVPVTMAKQPTEI